ISYPILLDPTLENYYRWSPQFGLPRHYFVGPDGTVLREILGPLDPQLMVDILDELLGPAT
ncbi:MAG: TlpA family protein disulfide reductase, partial [Candidatus Limnocylindria bacterium]